MCLYYICVRILIVKISIKDIEQSSSLIELFRSECRTEATFELYTTYLKRFVNEFLARYIYQFKNFQD